MPRTPPLTQLGHFKIVRALRPSAHAQRFLAIDEHTNLNITLHGIDLPDETSERRRLVAAVERLAAFRHPHVLDIDTFSLGPDHRLWVSTPFTGNHEGLVLLSDLTELRGGPLAPAEVSCGIAHLLDAIRHAHSNSLSHGPITPDEIQCDRRGSLFIEFYGLERLRDGLQPANDLLIRDEIRSIVSLAYTLLTGLDSAEPRIRASRLMKRSDRAWDQWIEAGLDPFAGFATAKEAIDALPGSPTTDEARPPVTILSKLGLPSRVPAEAH
ncbi:MAG: hypothetical protein ACF8Q5_07695 [Phycisphaerales bacterium JB040]